MSKVNVVIQLKQASMFEQLSNPELLELADIVQKKSFDSGSVVVQEGEFDASMYLITEGQVEVRKEDTVLTTLSKGTVFGEMALFEGGVRQATVIATDKVELLKLPRRELMRLSEQEPGIVIGICRALSKKVRALNNRLAESDSLI